MKNILSSGANSKKRLFPAFQPKTDPLDYLQIYKSDFRSYSEKMLMQTSLPAQLQWADRSSMAFGVESRAPFLDYRLVEFCINLPSSFKLSRGINKKIMRESLGHRMIKEVLDRPGKQGFESPESKWLLEDGFDETLSYLSKVKDVNSDIFPESALVYLDDIVHGRVPYDSFLWRAISLTSWRLAFDV
jgi:asparagine synthase (glutamine-hydrolysing)